MKITILSGGSGNDKIVKGLAKMYKNCDVKVILNAYDSGKSTGICRKVTDTLGVSDIRKNHSRMYAATSPVVNQSILEFYNGRYNLEGLRDVITLLDKWDLTQFNEYAKRFFNRPESSKYEYKDFSIANIIYSEMYAELGYEKTNKYFTDMLGIDDFVILNSFDNVYLKAITESGYVIEDEGDLVEWCNPDDKIVRCDYSGRRTEINPKAIERILDSDLILISTGTFWSSIYPTLDYLDFYKYINQSKAKKIWTINNIEDKDSYGVSSNDFIDHFKKLGLDMTDFTILENLDSVDSLHLENDKCKIVYAHMENNKGQHDPMKFVKEIFKAYYGITGTFDKIIFDFDDTIWSRKYKESVEDRRISIENVNIINSMADKAIIVSGNTYSSIAKKLFEVFGTDLKNCELNIWADVNARNYYKNEVKSVIKDFIMHPCDVSAIGNILNDFGIEWTTDRMDATINIKVKHLSELERTLLSAYLNEVVFSKEKKYIAKKAGYTTVDIMSVNNSKKSVFDYLNLGDVKTLYIGDEIDSGNDRDIATACTTFVNVVDAKETNFILKLIGEN